ncbi:acyltransferase family protein [Geodermatophilus nigrescens]|uniref:Acyltransferase family protein n=1 Tax=Geodermatophilus nigrescens TaxID=1070870 RepID=A0A1M5NNK6_9ACTN|nr:acyltransferase family protein [Geodermatophilus nigrescens]SHG91136.1 Acyltransferase family protein [Geodermatophilus nigrescens]
MTRDRGPDLLRALALAGVVLGHWLVTAPGAPGAVDGRVVTGSPLAGMPALAPVSWLLQTLALFFLVAGWAAARGTGARRWSRTLRRAAGPVVALVAAVAALATALAVAGASQGVVRTVVTLSLRPLWFLGVYLVLSLATPLLVRLDARLGAAAAVLPLGLALAGPLVPGTAGTVATALAAWWVPWQLGVAAARREPGPGACVALLAGGVLAVVLLVTAGGLPVTAVGVPGVGASNLDPPSAATLALGLAQAGAAGLLLPVLRRARGPLADAAVATGRSALPVFLLHQPLFVLLWLGTLPAAPLPGLHDLPDDPAWLVARAGWVLVLAGLTTAAVRALGARPAAGRYGAPL